MKIDRLIGILSVLLQEEKVTAPMLAERFEVSRRTIQRDIEDLCKAGIPISTSQGIGGGIRIMDGYRMDRTILTSKDMQMILAGLRSLDSVSGSHYYGQLMEKIKAGSSELVSGSESILIDLSSWYKDSLAPKIELIQTAIEERRVIHFAYYAPSGDSIREIEPYYLIFKWSSWYVWGRMTFCERKPDAARSETEVCRSRNEYRMFKLNRMDKIVQTEERAAERKVPMPDLSPETIFPGNIYVKAVFDPSMKWHLIEEFGPDSFALQQDGTLLFEHEYTDQEHLLTWMLSCKDKVTVLEPEDVRNELFHIADNIRKKYEEESHAKTEK